jgi:hypothetical protein
VTPEHAPVLVAQWLLQEALYNFDVTAPRADPTLQELTAHARCGQAEAHVLLEFALNIIVVTARCIGPQIWRRAG